MYATTNSLGLRKLSRQPPKFNMPSNRTKGNKRVAGGRASAMPQRNVRYDELAGASQAQPPATQAQHAFQPDQGKQTGGWWQSLSDAPAAVPHIRKCTANTNATRQLVCLFLRTAISARDYGISIAF
jgi:hypothetical protein